MTRLARWNLKCSVDCDQSEGERVLGLTDEHGVSSRRQRACAHSPSAEKRNIEKTETREEMSVFCRCQAAKTFGIENAPLRA